jgi:hypothetical protein
MVARDKCACGHQERTANAVHPRNLLAGDAVVASQLAEKANHGAGSAGTSDQQCIGNGFPTEEGGLEFAQDEHSGLARRVLADDKLARRH